MIVPSTEVQNNFGKYLKIAQELEDVVITRKGREIAKLVSCVESSIMAEEAVNYIFNGKGKVTYEEFLELAENSDLMYEYIDGEVYCLASPTYHHQIAVDNIYVYLFNFFKKKKCRPLTSPFDVTLVKSRDQKNVVQPDIIVICDTEKIDGKDKYQGVPSLAVEVLSNSSKRKDMIKKLDLYMQTGIKEYWMVDTEKKEVYVYSFENENIKGYDVYLDERTILSKAFEGLEIPLKEVFPDA